MAYPEQVSITTGEVTKENASVTYTVNAGSLPAEPSTTAGVAKSPAGELYPSYEGAPSDVQPEPEPDPTDEESGIEEPVL